MFIFIAEQDYTSYIDFEQDSKVKKDRLSHNYEHPPSDVNNSEHQYQALKEPAQPVIYDLADSTESLLDSAKSSTIYDLADSEDQPMDNRISTTKLPEQQQGKYELPKILIVKISKE